MKVPLMPHINPGFSPSFVFCGSTIKASHHFHRVSICCWTWLMSRTMPNKSFLQARCDEPIFTSDWGLPLLLALLLLLLIYSFLYLPATSQRALLEQALSSNNTTTAAAAITQKWAERMDENMPFIRIRTEPHPDPWKRFASLLQKKKGL